MPEPGKINSHKDLDVWQKSIALAELAYLKTIGFPRDEIFGLTSQIRRSAVSIAANIAEGYGRDQTGQFIQFVRISLGSARELDTHLIIATRVKYLTPEVAAPLTKECDDICRMLRALIRSLEAKKS
jgi:four helix bundle protein